MQELKLYKTPEGQGYSIGPVQKENSEEYGKRLIADTGKTLTNGETTTTCIDIFPGDDTTWEEINAEDTEEITWEEAGKILSGEGGNEE